MEWKDSVEIFLRTVQKETTLYEIREALELGPAQPIHDGEISALLVELGWKRRENRVNTTVWQRQTSTKPECSARVDKGLRRKC